MDPVWNFQVGFCYSYEENARIYAGAFDGR